MRHPLLLQALLVGLGCYAGTDSWQPQGTGDLDLLTYRIHGRTVRAASLALGGSGGLSRVIHGRLRIDLRGAHRFSAHGFSGVVRSTLVLRLGRAKAVPHSQGSPVPTSGQRTRIVNVTYRVQRLRGTAVADIRASSDAAVCGPLDACGLSGTT
jgi:hypothetical protein